VTSMVVQFLRDLAEGRWSNIQVSSCSETTFAVYDDISPAGWRTYPENAVNGMGRGAMRALTRVPNPGLKKVSGNRPQFDLRSELATRNTTIPLANVSPR
jgi:hypothetical protein